MTKETYYFDVDNWEYTTEDRDLVEDGVHYAIDDIVQIGVLQRLPDIFYAQRYNEAEDEYEGKDFATREEAQKWQQEVNHD